MEFVYTQREPFPILFVSSTIPQYPPTQLLPGGSLLDFLILTSVQHDFIRMSGSHARMSFGPIVRDSVGEDGAVAVECSRRNRAWGRIECFEERKNPSVTQSG